MSGPAVALLALAAAGAALTLPRWLPPAVVRLREWIFLRVNGAEGIPVPGPLIGAEHFAEVYAHPAADGRSRGAGLSDLFWYWLSPGAHLHQEHLEPGPRYAAVAATTRQVLAVAPRRSAELAGAATRRILDGLPGDRPHLVRLRELAMPLWAEVYHELVFGAPCPRQVRDLIVANATDVVTALKCCGLRHMDRRNRLTAHLLARVLAGTAPVTLPAPFTEQETAWYLHGTFFTTAVVQMSEATAHLLLAVAEHPEVQRDLVGALGEPGQPADAAIDRVIDETLRLYPLFGIAHRITSAPIELPGVRLPAGSVLLFNYLAYQRTGPAGDEAFDPGRWSTLPRGAAHFIPFGVTANRACPARGSAPVMLRAVTREVLRRHRLASSVAHTRSLPSAGPCFLVPVGVTRPCRVRLAAMRLGDRWADVWRSVLQLALGTWMVLDARRLRLCTRHFAGSGPADAG